MAKDMFWTIVTFAIIVAVLALAFWPVDKSIVIVRYDCRQLVDAPVAIHEECSKRGVTK